MFRESDYVPPRLHQSYKDRKVPEMQQRSQISQFDDVPDRRLSYNQCEPDVVVPPTQDTLYNPDHPDADWSGLVSKDRMHRRHLKENPNQVVGIVQQEDGIMPRPGHEAKLKHRGIAQKEHSTSSLIGGISAAEDQYKTTAHRQQNQEGLSKDQLVLKKRIGARKSLDPHHEMAQHHQAQHNQNAVNFRQQPQQNNGYGYIPQGVGGKSFTANLGAALVSRVPDKPPSSCTDSKDFTKTMLSQNYNPRPGYTGHKKI